MMSLKFNLFLLSMVLCIQLYIVQADEEKELTACFDALINTNNVLSIHNDMEKLWDFGKRLIPESYNNQHVIVIQYITYLKTFSEFNETILDKNNWCLKMVKTCVDALLRTENVIPKGLLGLYALWSYGKHLGSDRYDVSHSIVKRYIKYLKSFDKYYVDIIMGRADWCESIESKCVDRIRMLGFIIEDFSNETLEYNLRKNKEHAVNIYKDKLHLIPNYEESLDFRSGVVAYVEHLIKAQSSDNMQGVVKFCTFYCYESLTHFGYDTNSLSLSSCREKKKIAKEDEKKNYGCVVLFTNQRNNLNWLFGEDMGFSALLPWCESKCI